MPSIDAGEYTGNRSYDAGEYSGDGSSDAGENAGDGSDDEVNWPYRVARNIVVERVHVKQRDRHGQSVILTKIVRYPRFGFWG